MESVNDDRRPENDAADAADIGAADAGTDDAGAVEADSVRSGEEPAENLPPLRLHTLLTLAVILFALDLLTKCIVVATITPGDPIPIIGDFARFALVRNPGAAFSMATGMTWLLSLVALGVVIGVIRIGRKLRSLWWAIGLGMVLGGAVGNLADRLFRAPGPLQGHVVDFVAVGSFPVFNVADSAIVCGAALLVVATVFGFELDGTRVGHDDEDDDSAHERDTEHTGKGNTT
ncbi:signal peptidase II [Nocardia higoensis]|uniref:signal peptidase II n=1 Tax=Nocardia higoensis TaxID=228599 RepID=UPI001FDF3CCD|nr:signal peptidase II [Nocardia higoensis]